MKTSNSFSTYDFALATVHTTEKTENNLNSSTIVTDTSASTNPTPTKNNKDSNIDNTYESLSNYNTDLFSTNSSSITPTSEINRSLINLTKNVRRNMRTAKNEFDNFFKQNSENTESGIPFSPQSKIPLESIADEIKPDIQSEKFLWETETFDRLFTACCMILPLSLLLAIVGYSIREEVDGRLSVSSPLQKHQNNKISVNLLDSENEKSSTTLVDKSTKVIQLSILGFSIGVSLLTIILTILVIIFFVWAIYLLLSSGSWFA